MTTATRRLLDAIVKHIKRERAVTNDLNAGTCPVRGPHCETHLLHEHDWCCLPCENDAAADTLLGAPHNRYLAARSVMRERIAAEREAA